MNATSSVTMVDGTAGFVAVYLPKAATLTGIMFQQGVVGNYTADNNNYLALYTYSGGTLHK
jgi:hypothetical protein